MEEPTQQAFTQSRQSLNPFSGFHNSQAQPSAVPFTSIDPHLQDLDSGEVFAQHFRSQLADPGHNQHLRDEDPFTRNIVPRFQEVHSRATPPQPRHTRPAESVGGQFGILTPHAKLSQNAQRPRNAYIHHNALDRIQRDYSEVQTAPPTDESRKKDGHFDNAKSIPNPPNLLAWRERLFEVDETITLSEDEYASFISASITYLN